MSIATSARFARRELRGGLRGFRIFLACLALGVAAIAAVGSVRSAIEAGLEREGAALLGGDAELDFTYRFATDTERAWMDEVADTVSEIADFRSMAVVVRNGETERGLTQIKAVDDAYPLVGSVVLAPEMNLPDALAGADSLPGAVMERALIDRLGLSVGDTFRLGTQEFVLMATLVREPDSAAGGFGLGPRTIVLRSALENAQLLAPGTLFNSKYRLDLPDGTDLAGLEALARDQFDATGMRWTDARNGRPRCGRIRGSLGRVPCSGWPVRSCRGRGRCVSRSARLPRGQNICDCDPTHAGGRASGDFSDLFPANWCAVVAGHSHWPCSGCNRACRPGTHH